MKDKQTGIVKAIWIPSFRYCSAR